MRTPSGRCPPAPARQRPPQHALSIGDPTDRMAPPQDRIRHPNRGWMW
jgi:hypothetical protein